MRFLATATKQARRLRQTNVALVARYGHHCHGMAPTHQVQNRRMAADSVGVGGNTMCLTTTLELAYGEEQGPAFVVAWEQLASWLQLWTTSSKQEAREVWHKLHARLARHPGKWGFVKGPLGATVAALSELGWTAS